MNQNNYTGITIGPLFNTIDTARTTRELWASSYLFSYIVRKLLEAFDKDSDFEIVMPVLVKDTTTNKTGAGLYPDRIILQDKRSLDQQKENKLYTVVEKVISKLSKDMATRMKMKEGKVEAALKEFLQLNAQTIAIKEGQNIVLTMAPYLESIELSPALPSSEGYNSIIKAFLNGATLKKKGEGTSFLCQDGFGESHEGFLSLIEIAASDFELKEKVRAHFEKVNENSEVDDEASLLESIIHSFGDQVMHRHQHIAIVHADGDNVGASIKKIGNDKEGIQAFSKFLYHFAKQAAQKIADYGGLPIYVGGDDLFFIAPVARNRGKKGLETILHLAHDLDQSFKTAYMDLQKERKKLADLAAPTLSFGIDIAHYKTPLYEGVRQSRELLFEFAKNKKKHPKKHTIALRMATHSGNTTFVNFDLNQVMLFAQCRDFMKYYMNDDVRYLSSFSRRVQSLDPLFQELIGKSNIDMSRFIAAMNENEGTGNFDKRLISLLHNIYKIGFTEAKKLQRAFALCHSFHSLSKSKN